MDDDRTLMDRIRALVEGTLSPDEAAVIRREIEDEADGPELLAAYRVVHEVTVPTMLDSVETAVPVELPAVASRSVSVRRWLVRAAVILLCLGAGFAAQHLLRNDAPNPQSVPIEPPDGAIGAVRLAALAYDSPPVPSEPTSIPAALADYRSVRDGDVVWLDDVATARRISELTSRPILYFIHHPSCPVCVRFEGGPLQDSEVQRRLDALVLVRIDVTAVPVELREAVKRRLEPRRWPYLAVEDREGRLLAAVEASQVDGAVVAGQLDTGLSAVPDLENRIDWERANRAARRLVEGNWAFGEGRMGDAHHAFGEALRDGVGPMAEVARGGLDAVRSAAHVRFDEIRQVGDPGAAITLLAKAIDAFEGTPYADEFEAVRLRLVNDGRFPKLTNEKDD